MRFLIPTIKFISLFPENIPPHPPVSLTGSIQYVMICVLNVPEKKDVFVPLFSKIISNVFQGEPGHLVVVKIIA